MARHHGVSRVSRVLRLDYYRLQRRVRVRDRPSASKVVETPKFIEIKLAPLSSPAGPSQGVGSVELFDGTNRRLRIETGNNPNLWLALAESFWRAEG